MYFNSKDYHLVVLIGIAERKYRFDYVHIGICGKDRESSIFKQTDLWKLFKNGSLILPAEIVYQKQKIKFNIFFCCRRCIRAS